MKDPHGKFQGSDVNAMLGMVHDLLRRTALVVPSQNRVIG